MNPQAEALAELPFSEHLRELRRRLVISLGYLVVAFVACWFVHEEIFGWLMHPYRVGMAERFPELAQEMQFRSLIEPLIVYLKACLLAAFLLTAPLMMHQLWLFVAPGLYAHERRLAMPFLVFTLLFFFGGVLFCRYLVLEPAIIVLLGTGGVNTSPMIMMQEYFGFTSRLLVVFGLLFELPVAIAFLTMIGVLDSEKLIRNWKYAAVGAIVVGAMLTPPDPLTQVALALPLVVLYTLSIGVAMIVERRRPAAISDEEGATAPGAVDAERANRAQHATGASQGDAGDGRRRATGSGGEQGNGGAP